MGGKLFGGLQAGIVIGLVEGILQVLMVLTNVVIICFAPGMGFLANCCGILTCFMLPVSWLLVGVLAMTFAKGDVKSLIDVILAAVVAGVSFTVVDIVFRVIGYLTNAVGSVVLTALASGDINTAIGGLTTACCTACCAIANLAFGIGPQFCANLFAGSVTAAIVALVYAFAVMKISK